MSDSSFLELLFLRRDFIATITSGQKVVSVFGQLTARIFLCLLLTDQW